MMVEYDVVAEHLCSNQAATEALAAAMAVQAKPGDLFALTGDLGAGKSTFARAFIRARLGDTGAEVPSPTFTLVQTYGAPDGANIIHTDLYRLRDPDEVYDLGLEDERESSILIVEWPDRLPEDWQQTALHIMLHRPAAAPKGQDEERMVTYTGNRARWQEILTGLQV